MVVFYQPPCFTVIRVLSQQAAFASDTLLLTYSWLTRMSSDGRHDMRPPLQFLANVNSRSRSLKSSHVRLSVVCNVRAPYLGDSNFRQCFYAIGYLGHPWQPGKILQRSSEGNPSDAGVKHKRGNVRAPYSGDWNFRQCFYAIWYLGHPLTSR